MSVMTACAVTGSSGYLGQRLVLALAKLPEVKRVVGVDIVPPATSVDKLAFVQMDVRDQRMADALEEHGVTSLVHCAFQVQETRDARAMFDVNVGGTRNTLRRAGKAGVRSVVVLSSYTVYGAWPDNPWAIKEEQAVHPNVRHLYAEHKIASELLCQRFSEAFPGVSLTVLRPAMIMGPHCRNGLGASLIKAPFLPVFSDHVSKIQFVHEDDLADACVLALRYPGCGVFNIGAEGSLTWEEVVSRAGRRPLAVAPRLLESLVNMLWKLGIPGLSSASELPLIRFPLVVDSTRAQKALGWRARYSTATALESLVRGEADA